MSILSNYYANESSTDDNIVTPDMLNEDVMLEVYFGDKPLREAQAALTKFRSKWLGKEYTPKINYDADLIRFNRIIEKTFGYYRFCLTVDNSYDYNAYMYCLGSFAYNDIYEVGAKGLKINKSANGFSYTPEDKITAAATIFFGLLSDKKLTDREIMGVLLHEIGHSFTFSVIDKSGNLGRFYLLNAVCSKVNSMIKNNLENDRDLSEDKVDNDISGGDNIFSAIGRFFSKSKLIASARASLHSFASSVIKGMRGNIANMGYTDEKFADTFASLYGYGADNQSAIAKMMDVYFNFYLPKKTPSKFSIFLTTTNLSINNILDFIFGCKDPHPDGLARIKTQMDYLNKELRNTAMDPKMKAELQAQLDAQKKLIDDYINCSDDPDAQKAYRIYYTKLYKKYGGDIRETVTNNDALFDTIEDRYNGLKNKNEAAEIDGVSIDRSFISTSLPEGRLQSFLGQLKNIMSKFTHRASNRPAVNLDMEESASINLNEFFGLFKKKEYVRVTEEQLALGIAIAKEALTKSKVSKDFRDSVNGYTTSYESYMNQDSSAVCILMYMIYADYYYAVANKAHKAGVKPSDLFIEDANRYARTFNQLCRTTHEFDRLKYVIYLGDDNNGDTALFALLYSDETVNN